MSWLPKDKLTAEEKDRLKEIQQRKDSLTGKYHTQIKSQITTHETWLNTFISNNTKKRVQKCQDYHEKRIDKVELTIDDLQAYAIYATAITTFKETKDKTTKQYNKDLQAIELEYDRAAKEINKEIQLREEQQEQIRANLSYLNKKKIEQKKLVDLKERVKVYCKTLKE